MAYKIFKTESGYLPVDITGDGLILAKADFELPTAAWCVKVAGEFRLVKKVKESELFTDLANFLYKGGFVRHHELINLGFSKAFADAWEAGQQSGLLYLSLMGIEMVAGNRNKISNAQFEANMAEIFEEKYKP